MLKINLKKKTRNLILMAKNNLIQPLSPTPTLIWRYNFSPQIYIRVSILLSNYGIYQFSPKVLEWFRIILVWLCFIGWVLFVKFIGQLIWWLKYESHFHWIIKLELNSGERERVIDCPNDKKNNLQWSNTIQILLHI